VIVLEADHRTVIHVVEVAIFVESAVVHVPLQLFLTTCTNKKGIMIN
jgi:hypothetical protein